MTREEMQRRMNERQGLGLLGSIGAFAGLVALSAVLMVASIDAADWAAYLEAHGGWEDAVAGLLGSDDAAGDPQGADASDSAADPAQDAQGSQSSPASQGGSSSASAEPSQDAAEPEPEPLDLEGKYYYSQLDASDREKYELMYRCLAQREEVRFPGTNVDDVNRFYQYVMGDCPEIFYENGFNYATHSDENETAVKGNFYYSVDEAARYEAELQSVVQKIESSMPKGDDYAKAKHVYDYLIANVSYDHSVEDPAVRESNPPAKRGQTVVNALVEHSCVCNGYAQAFQLVMQDCGIPCALVEGDLADGSGSHAWNLAKLDGDWYYIDVTWGDPDSSRDYVPGESIEATQYGYLGATTADVAASRGFASWQTLPDCTATADNYFVREGLRLKSADTDKIAAWGDASVADGLRLFTFQCADQQTFDAVLSALQNGINMANGSAYRYQYDDKVRSFIVAID